MRDPHEAALRQTLGRGEWPRLAYRLGRQGASGVLTLTPSGARPDVFVLRRGAAVCGDNEVGRRAVIGRLARLAAEPALAATFDGGVTAYPPGAAHQVALADWARTHLEAQLDGALAEALVGELTGARLSLRGELLPIALDDADRRMIGALAQPRRLDQIWSLARTPRFRLLAFLHFLRGIGALVVDGVAAEPPRPRLAARPSDPRLAAARTLGVDAAADADTIKRAYRRLARTLHPDLQPDADEARRRTLERRFAEVTAAYEALV
ncbi:MAG TPA: J domain-containing protein [Kofleriaceae bacterium]|nr:J domain-containing protein [Kofleriaceae bacterium]